MGRVVFPNINSAVVRTATAAALMLIPGAGWAQPSKPPLPTLAIAGEIKGFEAGNNLRVELRGDGARFDAMRALVSPSGRFEFSRIERGQYELLVTTLKGDVIHHEFLSVESGMDFLRVQLPEKPAATVLSGTVSFAQLQRKVPRKAVKEYEASLRKVKKGDTQGAVKHLDTAIALAPDYTEAHNQLGVCQLKQQHLAAAAEEFQTAAKLDPGAVGPALNLSFSLYLLKRFSDAEVAARNALRLNPALSKARYLLGMSLHAENHLSKEMLEDLKRVADEFPDARLAVADALARLGRKAEAVPELEHYLLQPGGTKDRHAVEIWLADLRR
jgi:tetratricopeptide (TPR) repeat protein